MRAFLRFSVIVVLFCAPAIGWSQQDSSQGRQTSSASASSSAQNKDSAAQADQSGQSPASQTSLAEAARRSREEKKALKPAKVYTNDNIPTSGGISQAAATPTASVDGANTGTPSSAGKDEKAWRDKFAQLHHKLDTDKENLDVMQRELSNLNLQYYPDPLKAMQQQYSREDINKKSAEIETKKKEIASDQQAIDDAEDDLRKAGGDPGWAR